MTKQTEPGGSFQLPGTSLMVYRMGYGAMQLAGPQVWGPPRDVNAAIAVLREAVAAGLNHRHQRLLRSARNKSSHQAGAPSLPGWAGHCYQGRRSPRRRQILDPCSYASGIG